MSKGEPSNILRGFENLADILKGPHPEKQAKILGSVFGRTDFSRIFIFGSRILGCRIFFSSFLWEKVPRKILQENPRENPPKFTQQKSPTHFCRGPFQKNRSKVGFGGGGDKYKIGPNYMSCCILIFYMFFCSGPGKGGVRGARKKGSRFLLKVPQGYLRGERGGHWSGGCLRGLYGVGGG